MTDWIKSNERRIGTVVGDASTDTYTFILKSFSAKLGDIVATPTDVPGHAGTYGAIIWGRVVGINRVNPFFPAEAAQELSEQDINLLDTVLSTTRDYLQAEVLILGATKNMDVTNLRLSPVTYPVKPSAGVFSPPAEAIRVLLTGGDNNQVKLRLGTLIGRKDVDVSLQANKIVSRHLAILAMTGGGKTVAARRVLRELTAINYPIVILDPHGDYLAFFEKRRELGGVDVKLFYPAIRVYGSDSGVIEELIAKMGHRLTDPQKDFFQTVVAQTNLEPGMTAERYIAELITTCGRLRDGGGNGGDRLNALTVNAVRRSLDFVRRALNSMQTNNERLMAQLKPKGYAFTELPDPQTSPDEIVRPGRISIIYLAGFDHLTQSAIASIVIEHLFAHRAKLTDRIAPFLTVIEEAHNFVPGRREGTEDTPSLATVRKVITEGRKFGTGLMLISQRPARLDETILSQCNSFLVLRLVNPKDKNFVRSVMENLSESDANILQTFGPGQGIVSGQAVRFPLLVDIDFDEDLVSEAIGDEDFVKKAKDWSPDPVREEIASIVDEVIPPEPPASPATKRAGKRAPLPDVTFNAGTRGGKPNGAGKRPRA
ncbi:ATP-binding protein [Microvirga terricola]|uniref:ATP-binding protein n=1 Tax=Microvirga terricola TaxID=2719797 RepID=A0ABX0VBS0_9HYPH|nr:ATP-binding protein [Microvirga terricola]NIX75267.1 ATP-binding protein [Microvirga terricola]